MFLAKKDKETVKVDYDSDNNQKDSMPNEKMKKEDFRSSVCLESGGKLERCKFFLANNYIFIWKWGLSFKYWILCVFQMWYSVKLNLRVMKTRNGKSKWIQHINFTLQSSLCSTDIALKKLCFLDTRLFNKYIIDIMMKMMAEMLTIWDQRHTAVNLGTQSECLYLNVGFIHVSKQRTSRLLVCICRKSILQRMKENEVQQPKKKITKRKLKAEEA